MPLLEGTALLVARIATGTNTLVTLAQSLQAGNALLAQAHAEGREVSKTEVDAVFGEDDATMLALDQKLKALGA
jgi:hypothetical protein